MSRVALVDSGICNLDSVRRALEVCGAQVTVARSPGDMDGCERVVLPGVGAFPDAMRRLRDAGFDHALADTAADGRTPILGVCLGMQLLASTGFEYGREAGLALIPGEVHPLVPEPGERIPHSGWNEVHPTGDSPLFEGLADGSDFYFVHSYRFCCSDPADATATTPFAGGFTSAVGRGLVHGVQFHPEKSQATGFGVIRNFLAL